MNLALLTLSFMNLYYQIFVKKVNPKPFIKQTFIIISSIVITVICAINYYF